MTNYNYKIKIERFIMKLLFTFIPFLLISHVIISEETKDIISKSHNKSQIKTFKLKNGINFSSYTSNGSWEDNLGNYGVNNCMGTVKKMLNNAINLNIMCESTDKKGYKTWSVLKRNSNSMGSGVGYAEIIDSTVPHKELWVGTRCTYATNYLKDVNFTMQKCSVSNKVYKKFLVLDQKKK